VSGLRSLALEVRRLAQTIQDETSPAKAGPIIVSGMLCEQLARELGAGAEPGSVRSDATSRLDAAEVLVHVMAAEPSPADETLIRSADRAGVPVVLVQLWPQENWTPPFVLTPFVVECRAGEGFPLQEIARRIFDAAEHAPDLARRVPVLHDVVSGRLVGTSVIRAALIGAAGVRMGAARPLLALEQVRALTRLRSLQRGAGYEELPVVAGAAASAVALSFLLRGVARRARRTFPGPVVDAAVAAGATWMLAEVVRRFERPTP
jgi:nicotinamidase-related amidase